MQIAWIPASWAEACEWGPSVTAIAMNPVAASAHTRAHTTCTVVCILQCPLQVCINDKLYIQQGALLCIHTVIWWKREMCIKERRIRIKGSGTVVTTLPVADSGCQWCQHDSPSLYWSRNWRQKGLENLKLFTENLCLNGFTFCEAKYSFIFHLFSLAFKQAVHPFQRY